MFWRILLIVSIFGCAECLMCYQCAGSNNENKCQTYVRTMRKYQRLYWENGNLGRYIKNCSGFGGLPEDKIYCHISTVKSKDDIVLSYIRGCSDGKHFFNDPFDEMFDDKNVLSNNKSTCLFSLQGYEVCISMCGPNQDFCNGPTTSATNNKPSVMLILLLFLFYIFNLKFS